MIIRPGFVLREVGDGTLVVPTGARVLDMNGLIVLNPTGKRIWELLADARSVESITGTIAGEFDVDADTARRDVAEFIDQLHRMGVVEDGKPTD